MDHIEECGIDEGPMGMPPAPEMDRGNPVTMNVNLNASGKDHVADLLDMMKKAGLGDAKPVDAKMLAPRLDMERLRGIVDEPAEEDVDMDEGQMKDMLISKAEGMDREDFIADAGDMGMDDREAAEFWDEVNGEMEGYANEPDEEFGDIEDVTASGDDLHKSKKGYRAAAGGDNPMAMEDIKSALYAALAEKKAKPDYIDIDGDGDKEEPMKKAVKDKEAKKK